MAPWNPKTMGELRLEHLLEDLRDDGQAESSGIFTLDASKAEEKLRNFAFSTPYHYILKLVQCAVAGRAEKIDLKINAARVEVNFDGQPLEAQDMHGLMRHLLNEEADRRLRHLAAGLRGAVGVRPYQIKLEVWNEEAAFRHSWEEEAGWQQEPLEPKPGTRHRLYLGRNLGEALKRAGSGLMRLVGMDTDQEEASLAAHCIYCPAQVSVDGEPVKRRPFGQPRYPGYHIAEDPNPGECRPPPYLVTEDMVDGLMDKGHHLLELCLRDDSEVPASLPIPATEATIRKGLMPEESGHCRAWLAVRAGLERSSEITYVEDGVLLCKKTLELPCPGLVGVFSAEALDKDLTGFQLVENERFREHLNWLEAQAREMRATLEESLALFPIRERVRAALES